MEANIKEKAKPYFLQAESDILAILIHGFTGTPFDLRELGEFLHSKNISIKAPLLPGHGTYWQELEKVTAADWLSVIEKELNEQFEQFKKIFLIGYSFGANLALTMATKYPEKIKGIVSLGVSVYLRNDFLTRLLLPIFHLLFKKYKKNYIKRKFLTEYEDLGCYSCIPTKSVFDFYNYIDNYTKKELAKVSVPTLIIHSHDDRVTHPKSSEFVHRHISSSQKELIILDDINHNPLNSRAKDETFERIEKFITMLRGER